MVSMSKQPMYHATCRKCGKQRMTLNPAPLCPNCAPVTHVAPPFDAVTKAALRVVQG